MYKFIKSIIGFVIFSLIIGEIFIRANHIVTDLPQRKIDEYGIQKYYPNQEGYWKGGKHKWTINKLGWPGVLPKNYDNLITIIGDSFIENFMNPNECHQSVFLKKNLENYNFLEASRSGVSFIEAMEITKQLDYLQPIQNLIYVNDNDFYESVVEIKPLKDITQVSIENNNVVYGEMKSPGLKKVLYNWKFLYYFYNRFPLRIAISTKKTKKSKRTSNDLELKSNLFELMDYVKSNYFIKNKTLVFHPNSNVTIVEKCKEVGFNVITLNSDNDESWTFEHDKHWTCYGHERVAKQVHDNLLKNYLIK